MKLEAKTSLIRELLGTIGYVSDDVVLQINPKDFEGLKVSTSDSGHCAMVMASIPGKAFEFLKSPDVELAINVEKTLEAIKPFGAEETLCMEYGKDKVLITSKDGSFRRSMMALSRDGLTIPKVPRINYWPPDADSFNGKLTTGELNRAIKACARLGTERSVIFLEADKTGLKLKALEGNEEIEVCLKKDEIPDFHGPKEKARAGFNAPWLEVLVKSMKTYTDVSIGFKADYPMVAKLGDPNRLEATFFFAPIIVDEDMGA